MMLSEAKSTLRGNGRTFWFASIFMSRTVAADAAELYAFCRTMDDLADQGGSGEGRDLLALAGRNIAARFSEDPCVKMLLNLASRRSFDLLPAEQLLSALSDDAARPALVEDELELIRYCYGVAGTVGLLMSAVVGAERGPAEQFAIDLGIAMQLTNIARDVLEDAKMGRRYLPGDWIRHASASQIASGNIARAEITSAVLRLLTLADKYYASARRGFPLIPLRSRLAVIVAAAVYREIGVLLREQGCQWWQGRIVVPISRKLWVVFSLLLRRSGLQRLGGLAKETELHSALSGLSGGR